MIENSNLSHRGRPVNLNRGSYATTVKNPMLALSDSKRNRSVASRSSAIEPVKNNKLTPARHSGSYFPSYKKKYNSGLSGGGKRLVLRRQKNSPLKKITVKNEPFSKSVSGDKGVMRVIPLGGCEEVGRNMTIFEYYLKGEEKNKDIIIIDMGLQFPEEDMPGIDFIIPNIEYLKGQEKNVRAVIFSHGHLDHIGAAPILLEKLGNPVIVGRPLTLEMIKHRQEDYKKNTSKNLKNIYIKSLDDQLKLGKFKISFFPVEHSVMDAVGIILETPAGTIIHPGDWSMDRNEKNVPTLSYHHLSNLKTPTVLMLEALAATHEPNRRVTEKDMLDNLSRLINGAPGRVIIGTFASQVERIKQIIEIAGRADKKVALDGYSMKINIEIAEKLGYVKIPKTSVIPISEIHKYDHKKLVILCTGAQGESNAVMSRIVNNNHKYIKIQKDDTIVFSSSIIPGNERTIQRLKDNMYRLSDNVIHSDVMDVHVSGHGTTEDIVEMLKQIQPTYFLPVYANHYMLKEAAKIAVNHGFPKDKIFVLDNGSILEFDGQNNPKLLDKKITTDYIFVDGLGVGDISHVVLRDRKVMAEDGMLVVIVTVDKRTGQLVHSPDIISRGFIYMKENKKLVEDTRYRVKKILHDTDPKIEAFPDYIKNKIRNDIGQFLFQKIERRPMVLPVVIEV